ncbi:hypothetical protein LY28_01492 [Ruminiclostridium sufflavum DSM 19573]|uniref:Glycerophosphoryl diester phosphodiesterase family protein n=2 Tax=Ruminiclostridium TaxID=1508657 RepID=A0A318XMZ7_9FIRM|nr:hypothetical protein LY28_01492 [Ruminiclostridium sufflavum DSM 19573]
MGTLNNAVRLLAKRPSILVMTIILSTIAGIAETLFITLFYGISMFKTGSPFDAYINIIQFLVGAMLVPQTAAIVILVLVILVVATALIFGLLLSGYFNMLNNAVQDRAKKEGSEFMAGVKKYFLRMISLNLWTLSIIILFVIYAFIASIPAAIFLDNAFSGAINVFAGILLSVITLLVLFFSFAFLRQYLVFWYPSALTYDRNHFKIAKKISDKNFWTLLSKFIIFDITLLIFDSIYVIANFSLANAQIVSGATTSILLIINIIFKTVFIALQVCFVFYSFNRCNDKYKALSKAK